MIEIEKVWVVVWEYRLLSGIIKLIFMVYRAATVCASYSVLLDFAFGLVQLVLQVPDDLLVFAVALLDHLPLPL